MADQLIQRRRAELVCRLRFFERGEQSFVVERGEQYVLVARACAELGSKLWQPRRDMLGRPRRHHVLWPDVRPFHERARRLRREPAVVAHGVLAHFIGDRFVALALHHVEHGLGDNVLRKRAHQNGIAEIAAHLSGLREDGRQTLFHLHGLQLRAQIGDHAAGYLVLVQSGIVLRHLAARLALAFGRQGNKEVIM